MKRINYIYTSNSSINELSNQNISENKNNQDNSNNNNNNNNTGNTLSVTTSGDTTTTTTTSKIGGMSEYSILTSSAMQSNFIRNNQSSSLHLNTANETKINNNFNNNNNVKIPSEPCFQYIVRILFTNYPPPYCYDYHIENPSEQSFDKVICSIKQMFSNCEIRRSSFNNRPSLSPQFINRSLNSKSVIIKKSEKLYQLKSPSHFSLRLTNNGNNICLDSNNNINPPMRKSKLHSTQIFPIEESLNTTTVIV